MQYPVHTSATAPERSRSSLDALEAAFGFVPSVGACGTLVALIALYFLKAIDVRLPRRQRGLLEIVSTDGVEPPDLDAIVGQLGCRARYLKQAVEDDPARNRVWFEIEWTDANVGPPSLRFLNAVAARYPVAAFTMQSESDD